MASPGNVPVIGKTKRVNYNQRQMGPAPFASFEDLSDDLDSPEERAPLKPMPEIREDVRMLADGTLVSPDSGGAGSSLAGGSLVGGSLQTPSTPRIDISRASSSSHHDSNNSSPERELYGEGDVGSSLGAGFKEEGTADLRSSTEELNFHMETGTVQEREMLRRRQKQLGKLTTSTVFKYELEAQSEKERKDSTCSDIGLLSISGRTSRLSSVGSAASGGSGVSHLSNTSRLSVTGSHISGVSGRSTSPHKMLLETSFCGSTPKINQSVEIESPPGSNKHERHSLEKVILAKATDPTVAVVGGDVGQRRSPRSSVVVNGKTVDESIGTFISIERDAQKPKTIKDSVKSSKKSDEAEGKFVNLKQDVGSTLSREEKDIEKASNNENPRPRRMKDSEGKYMREVEGTFISLKYDLGSSMDREDKGIEKPVSSKEKTKPTSKTKEPETKYMREVEGTFISLKYDLGSSLDLEERGIEKPPKPKEAPKPKKKKEPETKYLREVEGTFIPLKYDLGSSQDRESSQESDVEVAPVEVHAVSQQRQDSGRNQQKVERRAERASPTPVVSRPKAEERRVEKVTASPVPTKLKTEERKVEKPTSRSVSPKPLAAATSKKTEPVKQPLKEEKRIEKPKPRPEPIRYDSESDGIYIPLKYDLGSSQDREEREKESGKKPTLKECGKSSKLKESEGVYMREVEGTFISLKYDMGSSLDREERGVEIPITLNLSEAGKSVKPVQSFSQLVQKETVRAAKVQEPVKTQEPSKASPKPVRHAVLRKDEVGSRTPSPSSTSRKSSFTSLFKRGDAGVLSPESPSVVTKKKQAFSTILKEATDLIERNRARSKSRERPEGSSASISPLTIGGESQEQKLKKDARNKSVFSSFFKKKERKREGNEEALSPEMSSPEPTLPITDAISNVEFTFNTNSSQSSVATIRGDHPALPDDTLLPSESVMLPTLSHFYSAQKEPAVEAQKQEYPQVEMVVDTKRETDEAHHSSESERDSEVEFIGNVAAAEVKAEVEAEDVERKGFISHQDSVDEELPYIPTTLPQERSIGVPLVPAKQRTKSEHHTCPIDRPRSTTPINPSVLNEFKAPAPPPTVREMKMKISLPREDSITSKKSPRRGQARPWNEFAEQGLQNTRELRKSSVTSATSPSPPPLPPRAQATPPPQPATAMQAVVAQTSPPKPQSWINFEEIPEKRKPPKRIQTIPSRSNIEFPEAGKGDACSKGVVYSYVNPEDCKCECHEAASRPVERTLENGAANEQPRCSHATAPGGRLEVEDKNSCVSDSSCEYPNPYASEEYSLESLKVMKPFGMDLDVTSNRSSIISQDEPPSPDNEHPLQ